MAGTLTAPGCVSTQNAAATRSSRTTDTTPVAPDAWPARSLSAARSLHDALAGSDTVMLIRRRVVREDEELRPLDTLTPSVVTGRMLIGEGLLLDVRPVARKAPPPPPSATDGPTLDESGGSVPQQIQAAQSLVFLSFPASSEGISGDSRLAGFGELGVYLDVTYPPAEVPLRGIAVQFHGLGGVEFEQPVIDKLLAAGFVVLSGDYPWNRWRPVSGTLSTIEDVHALAREMGAVTDDTLAEAAFATEAATGYLQRTDPRLAGAPVVLVGFSAGSLATPTVAARLGERCAGMVLVASGCNLAAIAQSSELTNGGVQVMRFGKRVTGAMAGLLSGVYLTYTKLDPYHTGLALRRLPTLMIQGRNDTIVPTERGQELYERLNAPDIILYSGGHRTIFLALGSLSNRIEEWVVQHADPATAGTNGGSTAGNGAASGNTSGNGNAAGSRASVPVTRSTADGDRH
jgi:alpha-beta hydrolase superfamily lysophospholipase